MRIIGGDRRGVRLSSVGAGDAAAHLRPTSDRVRESLFNILLGGHFDDPVTDARVLDLFAGTGALGFEALSRGAAHVTFVDNGRAARALLRENTAVLQAGGRVKVFRRDATGLGPCQSDAFDLVFLDPPYGARLGHAALETARTGGWLSDQALIVWEENAPQAPPPGFARLDARRYGETHITFLRRQT